MNDEDEVWYNPEDCSFDWDGYYNSMYAENHYVYSPTPVQNFEPVPRPPVSESESESEVPLLEEETREEYGSERTERDVVEPEIPELEEETRTDYRSERPEADVLEPEVPVLEEETAEDYRSERPAAEVV